MSDFLTAFGMCQSMFCALPCPIKGWKEECRDQMLQCLPLVGLEIGVLWFAAASLCLFLKLPQLVTGLVIGFFPYFATGGIHLDGFMDVTDAIRSYRPLEKRREILKDSHVGSFAVIGVAMLLIAAVCLGSCVRSIRGALPLICIPVISRACAVIAVVSLPPMNTSQYVKRKQSPVFYLAPAIALGSCAVLGMFFLGRGFFSLLAVAAGYFIALYRGYTILEGMNGDISGYSLTRAELLGLAVMALLGG